jgi:hypothetical protein
MIMADWIKGAIEHKGALTARAKAAGMTVSQYLEVPHKSPVIKKEVALAKVLRGLPHKGKK